jgi:hypothetical protein
MNVDLRDRIESLIRQLHERALALSHPNKDKDIAQMISAHAVCLEALRAISDDVADLRSRLDRQ